MEIAIPSLEGKLTAFFGVKVCVTLFYDSEGLVE